MTRSRDLEEAFHESTKNPIQKNLTPFRFYSRILTFRRGVRGISRRAYKIVHPEKSRNEQDTVNRKRSVLRGRGERGDTVSRRGLVAVVLPAVDPVLGVSGSASSFRASYLAPYYYSHPVVARERVHPRSPFHSLVSDLCCLLPTEVVDLWGWNRPIASRLFHSDGIFDSTRGTWRNFRDE